MVRPLPDFPIPLMTKRLPLLAAVVSLGSLFFTATAFAAENDAVSYVIEHNIMAADASGNFQERGSVTRLEFTLAVVNAFYDNKASRENCYRNISPRLPVGFTRLYRDVTLNETYSTRVCVAMQANIVNSGDVDFRPFAPITVAEASKIMASAHGLTYPSKSPSQRAWYWSSMEALRIRGAIDRSDTASQPLTRLDMAEMFHALRAIERFPASRIIGGTPERSPLAAAAMTHVAVAEVVVTCAGSSDACEDRNSSIPVVPAVDIRTSTTARAVPQNTRISRRTLRNLVREARQR